MCGRGVSGRRAGLGAAVLLGVAWAAEQNRTETIITTQLESDT